MITHYANFLDSARLFNERRVRDFDPDDTMSMMMLKKWMLDWHPNISCFINIFSRRDLNDR